MINFLSKNSNNIEPNLWVKFKLILVIQSFGKIALSGTQVRVYLFHKLLLEYFKTKITKLLLIYNSKLFATLIDAEKGKDIV